MKTSEVLTNFFKNIHHNCARIAGWYTPSMEVQINVLKNQGEPDSKGVYTDDKQPYKWYNIRIPRNAKTEPLDNDHDLQFPLDIYAEYIGMTGWDWKNKQSVRFGFDYDSVAGHAAGVGITDATMEEVKAKAYNIPELLILRSTSGSGLHLYLECDPKDLPDTATHTEHSALALAALNDLSTRVGFDFHAHMDVGGGNMWVWARKMTPENQGLTVEKDNVHPSGDRAYYTPPENWRDYLEVAKGSRTTPRITGVDADSQAHIDKQNTSHNRVKLTAEHKRLIGDLHETCPDTTTVWLDDQWLLQTHTCALKRVFNRCEYIGLFDTLSQGNDLTKPNCFAYPQADGGWRVQRFGKGTNETPEWIKTIEGWTSCFFNSPITLGIASASKGAEDTDGGFVFNNQEEALKALRALGTQITIPEVLQDRTTKVSSHKDGRLKVEIVVEPKIDIDLNLTGWIRKKGQWVKLYGTGERCKPNTEVDLEILDEMVRSLVNPEHEPTNWAIRHIDGYWMHTKKDDAKTMLAGSQFAKLTAQAQAQALGNSWTRVNLPFQPEYPGGRKWNCDGAQWKIKPADLEADVEPQHPHWDMIIRHCSQDLDVGLKTDKWAIENNITSGYDYLMSWIVSVFRHPFRALPYLFFHGDQGSGKSILHEAIELLMTKGVVRADHALTNPSGFNGELAGAILCVVEEKNISTAPEAYARLKDWVTAISLGIRPLYKQVFSIRNSTHWMHMANESDNCPIFPGDTRVISMHVPFFENAEIPKDQLLDILIKEAPQFLASVQRWKLPDVCGRLQMPIIMTPTRSQQQESNRDPLESYINDQCYYAPGETVTLKDFYSKFITTLSNTERINWQKRNVIGRLKTCFPVGNHDSNQVIGNLSFSTPKTDNPTQRFIREGAVLALQNIEE